jgi:hypothetical protein
MVAASMAIALRPSTTAVVPYSKPGAVLSSSYTQLFPETASSSSKTSLRVDASGAERERRQLGAVLGDGKDSEVDLEENAEGADLDKDFYSLSVLKAAAASRLASGGGKRRRARDCLYFLDDRLSADDECKYHQPSSVQTWTLFRYHDPST